MFRRRAVLTGDLRQSVRRRKASGRLGGALLQLHMCIFQELSVMRRMPAQVFGFRMLGTTAFEDQHIIGQPGAGTLQITSLQCGRKRVHGRNCRLRLRTDGGDIGLRVLRGVMRLRCKWKREQGEENNSMDHGVHGSGQCW